MIIWINGAFGSGKTTTAFELHKRLDNSYVYDPENIGFFLRRNMPADIIQGDFQDQPLWRKFNYEIIKNIYIKYDGTIIIPMTIYNKDYYEEILGRLQGDQFRIDHYILGASRETIIKRLSKRLSNKDSWAARHIDVCLAGFEALRERSNYIDTNDLDLDDVVETIARQSNLNLKADRDPPIVRNIKRAIVQIKHIRLL
jgi:hypothetical protein